MTASDTSRGGDSPLVSVIVRSIDRLELGQALTSVAAQDYRPLEIILVDAKGRGILNTNAHSAAADVPLTNVSVRAPLSRPEAANHGLFASRGSYLMFLDEDDWIAPAHISGLLEAMSAQSDIKAAYSSTRKVDTAGEPLQLVFDHAYDPDLLKRDNFIPIHAMLFHRSLVHEGCRFDKSLDIYEDWDFWLQVSRKTRILHVDQLTAFYRQGGASQTDAEDDELRFKEGHPLAQAREKIYRKWVTRWDSAELNRFVGNTITHGEFARTVEQLENRSREVQELHDVTGSLRIMLNRVTRESEARKREAEELRRSVQRIKRDHALSDLHRDKNIQDLEEQLNEIYTMPSWRLMAPFRIARRQLDNQLLFPLKKKIHYWKYGTELESPGNTPLEVNPRDTAGDELAPVGQDTELKERYRQDARDHLQLFLQSDSQLPFPASASPGVSILLVLFNQAELTLLCLESILKFAPPACEVVIVDNASKDDTCALLEKLANVTVVRNAENLGFVRAVNQGLERCRGKYLLLLNNDAMLHLYAIESAIRTLETTPDAGAVGGRILLLDGSLQEAGSIIFSDGSCQGYGRQGIPDAPEYMFSRPVDYCSGAFFLCETDLFRQMDGFDDDYAPAYYEDSDFCLRLRKRGLKVIYDPGAVITHYEFASSGGQQQAGELQERHRLVLLRKHRDILRDQPDVDAGPALFSRTANDQRNLLIIDDCVPHASLGSGYPRSREIISVLAANGFNVSLYPLQFPEESWEATYQSLPGNVEVLLGHGTDGLADFLRRRQGFFDTILVSRIHNMEFLNSVLAGQPDLLGETRLIYDAEAITAPREIMRREMLGESFTEQERYSQVEQEIGAARTADTIIAVSPKEAGVYQQHGFSNTVVLGHSLSARSTANTFDDREGLLFVGALRDEQSPNVDSLHWFINEIWPLIIAAEPAMTLQVAGDNEASSLTRLDAPGLLFLGRVHRLEDLYNAARVFIAPTRFAAGIPHKVHEAAASGVPCVTTTLLADQLGWDNGNQLLAADTPREFADHCLALAGDPQLWQQVRDAALTAVDRDCSPRRFRQVLLDTLG